MKKNKLALCLSSAFLIAGLVSCNQGGGTGGGGEDTPPHSHTYVEHAQEANCKTEGGETYYTCSECDKVFTKEGNNYTELDEEPGWDFDSNKHVRTEVLAFGEGYKKNYVVGEEFDLDSTTFKRKCSECEGTTVLSNRLTVEYPTDGAEKFLVGDLTKQDLKVVVKVRGTELKAELPVTLSKKANNFVTEISNLEAKCGSLLSTIDTQLAEVGAKFGDVVITYAETENGEYKTAAEWGSDYKFAIPAGEASATYFYKATVAEGADYTNLEMTKTITVTHDDLKLVVTGAETAYVPGETFSFEEATVKVACSDGCGFKTLTAAEIEEITVGYPTSGETTFVMGDTTAQNNKVTFTWGTYTGELDVSVTDNTIYVTGLGDLTGECGFEPFETLESVTIAQSGLTPVYTFEVSEGDWKTVSELGDGYTFDVPTSETTRVINFKCSIDGGTKFEDFEETHTITLSHNYEWSVDNDGNDIYGCACSDPEVYKTSVTAENQDIDLSSDSDQSISLAGSGYANGDTIVSITMLVGEEPYDLGTDLTALDLTQVKADSVCGPQEIIVTTTDAAHEGTHTIGVPVTICTAIIANTHDSVGLMLPQGVYKNSEKTITTLGGYFKLSENLGQTSVQPWVTGDDRLQGNDNTAKDVVFTGTLDGNGKTIWCQQAPFGLFGKLNGATIKNVIIDDNYSYYSQPSGYDLYTILARGAKDTTLENVTFNVKAHGTTDKYIPNSSQAYILTDQFQGCTFRDVTVSFNNGSYYAGRVFAAKNVSGNTFENTKVICKGYYSLAYLCYAWNGGVNPVYGEAYTLPGVTVVDGSGNPVSVVTNLARQTITVDPDKVDKASISLEGSSFEEATISSIKLGNYELGTDITDLTFSGAAIADDNILGDKVLTITATTDTNTTPFAFDVDVKVELKQDIVPIDDVLTIAPQILDASVETAQTLSLAGTDYEGATVSAVKIDGTVVGDSLTNIVIPEALRTDKTKHGLTTAKIELVKDAQPYNVFVDIKLATRVMWNSVESVSAVLPYLASKTTDPMTGYYVLGETIDIANSATLKDLLPAGWYSGWENGGIFSGTFDGNGKTLKWKSSYSGLFHILNGATIKDLTVQDAWYKGCSAESSLLAAKICNTRLENVTLVAIANLNQTTKTTSSDIGSGAYGWVSRVQFQNNTVVNCSFNTGTAEVTRLFCTQNGGDNTFTNCTFTTAGYYSLYKHWKNGDLQTYNGITITGDSKKAD